MTREELTREVAAALDERLLVEDPPTLPGATNVLEDLTGTFVVVRQESGPTFVVEVREEVPA